MAVDGCKVVVVIEDSQFLQFSKKYISVKFSHVVGDVVDASLDSEANVNKLFVVMIDVFGRFCFMVLVWLLASHV